MDPLKIDCYSPIHYNKHAAVGIHKDKLKI